MFNFKLAPHASERQFQDFLNLVSKLNAFEFLGLLKILNVPILNDEDKITADTDPKSLTSRDFESLLDDAMNTFEFLPRASRKQVMHLLRKAIKEKSKELKSNGTPTENRNET